MDEEFFVTSGGAELIDEIAPLWAKLNEHHAGNSPHFGEVYRKKTFDGRKRALLEQGKGGVHVTLVLDSLGVTVGYCVCTVDSERVGEIDSLYVLPEHRNGGFGHTLMNIAMGWITEQGVKRTRLAVASGNEQVFGFYAKYGFFPAKIILEQMPPS